MWINIWIYNYKLHFRALLTITNLTGNLVKNVCHLSKFPWNALLYMSQCVYSNELALSPS